MSIQQPPLPSAAVTVPLPQEHFISNPIPGPDADIRSSNEADMAQLFENMMPYLM